MTGFPTVDLWPTSQELRSPVDDEKDKAYKMRVKITLTFAKAASKVRFPFGGDGSFTIYFGQKKQRNELKTIASLKGINEQNELLLHGREEKEIWQFIYFQWYITTISNVLEQHFIQRLVLKFEI